MGYGDSAWLPLLLLLVGGGGRLVIVVCGSIGIVEGIIIG